MIFNIVNVKSIEDYVAHAYQQADEKEQQQIVEAIRNDDHPPYNTNWNEYLSQFDGFKIIEDQE